MISFMDQEFLLDTETARQLFHQYAEQMPIVDYHCHIDPKDIYEDRRFDNLAQVWLGGDHYKWRLMRSNGIEERYITGDASDWEKFLKFAETLPRAIGNPMYHWCHLELKNFFGYDGILNASTARTVWDLCAEKLRSDPALSARGLILRSNVLMIGTTDDPCSSLEWHQKLSQDASFPVQVCPSFRPDPVLNIHKSGFINYLQKLEENTGYRLTCVEEIYRALSARMDVFDANGCRAADHGLDYLVYRPASNAEINAILHKVQNGQLVTPQEVECYQTALLLYCAREYASRNWVMQLHFSCVRNPNERMMTQLGPDTGFDCIAVTDSSSAAYQLMNHLEKNGCLPKTVLYSLNPADNPWIDSLLGAFQSSEIPGKIQHGSAWWFNDQKQGMTDHLISLANLSILGNFIGMLTDSRSLLSYSRHEYFRRILCALLGRWVENGEYPADLETLGSLVQDICTNNAVRYFNLGAEISSNSK